MSHRFGLITGGDNDLAGIWAPSNIHIGASYAVHDRLTLGGGITKFGNRFKKQGKLPLHLR